MRIVHRLDGAYERVKRARKHLANLKRQVTLFQNAIRDDAIVYRKPQLFQINGKQVMGVLGHVGVPVRPVPPIISITIGEITYNMRAALDYLIYDLAAWDSGRIQDKTQFPIESTEKGFVSRRNTFLKGISDEHVAVIKTLQPYSGCNWTGVLRDISNPDKHRRLTLATTRSTLAIAPGSTEAIIAGKPVDVKRDFSVLVTFSDGLPVIGTLQQLIPQITKVLDAFYPEFQGI